MVHGIAFVVTWTSGSAGFPALSRTSLRKRSPHDYMTRFVLESSEIVLFMHRQVSSIKLLHILSLEDADEGKLGYKSILHASINLSLRILKFRTFK